MNIKRNWYTKQEMEIVANLWNQGFSGEYIGQKIGRSRGSVLNTVTRLRRDGKLTREFDTRFSHHTSRNKRKP